MIRLGVLVEGQTEQGFCTSVLRPHFEARRILVIPKLKSPGNYGRMKRDLLDLLNDRGLDLVTTMIDFYGRPGTFPGNSSIPNPSSAIERVRHLEQCWLDDLGGNYSRKFVPYLQLHEFEAILFSDIGKLDRQMGLSGGRKALDKLQAIVGAASVNSPEDINDSARTSPSKRLRALFPAYDKTLHGPLVAREIGLAAIRAKCPHFNEWLSRLEALS